MHCAADVFCAVTLSFPKPSFSGFVLSISLELKSSLKPSNPSGLFIVVNGRLQKILTLLTLFSLFRSEGVDFFTTFVY